MKLTVTYHVRATAADIAARAQGIAVEQSVEMPLDAIDEPTVLSDIVGAVEDIDDLGDGAFRGAHRSGAVDDRGRCRAVAEHAVRQYVLAGGRGAGRCRVARDADGGADDAAAAPDRRAAPQDGGTAPRPHRLGVEAARAGAGAAGHAGGAAGAGRTGLHQGRPRAGRPGLQPLCRSHRRSVRRGSRARCVIPATRRGTSPA